MSQEEQARRIAEQLFHRYAEIIDDGDVAEWPDLFTEDGVYRLMPRENYVRGLPGCLIYCSGRAMLEDRAAAIKNASIYPAHVYRHHYSNLQVKSVVDDHADVSLNYLVIRTHEEGASQLFSTGRVLARVTLSAGPRFASKHVIYDASLIEGLLVIPL